MLAETMLLKVEGAAQASQFSGLAGKSFTVGKVSAVGNGMNNWLFLSPLGDASAGTVAVKLEGARQAAQFSGLAGKNIAIGKAPTVIGGASKWMAITPLKGAAAAAGTGAAAATGAGAAAADSSLLLMKVEGVNQASQIPALAGKKFTVMKAPMMGTKANGWLFLKPVGTGAGVAEKGIVALKTQNGVAASGKISSMVGKTYTLSKAPMAGNVAGKWIMLKPAMASTMVKGGAAASSAVVAKEAMVGTGATQGAAATKGAGAAKGGGAAIKGAGAANSTKAASTQGITALKKSIVTKSATTQSALSQSSTGVLSKGATNGAATTGKALLGKAGSSSAVKGAAATGTLWKGTGLSLGLGLGLGSWGPVILVGAVAATGAGIYSYVKKNRQSDVSSIDEFLS
ncbi:MAG: hypothetical protein HQL72_07165 [Magnetococcales bacterium]|nr:hypothetical protein [Magnetococcales bacterium]